MPLCKYIFMYTHKLTHMDIFLVLFRRFGQCGKSWKRVSLKHLRCVSSVRSNS